MFFDVAAQVLDGAFDAGCHLIEELDGSSGTEVARRMCERRQPLAVGKGFGIRQRQSQNVASVVQGRADEVEGGREANRGFGVLVQNRKILQMSVAVAYGAR